MVDPEKYAHDWMKKGADGIEPFASFREAIESVKCAGCCKAHGASIGRRKRQLASDVVSRAPLWE